MEELKQFDKVIKPAIKVEDLSGMCCLTGLCEDLNIKDIEDQE